MILMNRIARLIVFNEGDATGTAYDGLRISFDFVKVIGFPDNSGSVSIYNLGSEVVKSLSQKKSRIQILAGYGTDYNNLTSLIVAESSKFKRSRSGPNFITQIECLSGKRAKNKTVDSKSFAKGTQLSEIRKALINAVTDGTNITVTQRAKQWMQLPGNLTRAMSIDGNAMLALQRQGDKTGHDIGIDDDVLDVIKRDATTQSYGYVLDGMHGLISAEPREAGGVFVTALMLPDLQTGNAIDVKGKYVSGKYKVVRLTHKGDTRAGVWQTEIEAVAQ